MVKLISGNFVKNESHCIEMMLDSVQPYVEESYVLIDDTTTDSTEDICLSRGCKVKKFKFENFGKTWNTLLEWISGKSAWTVFIAPDETIDPDFGDMIKNVIYELNDTEVDGVWFPRRHWKNLEKTELFEKDSIWYPDDQLRLIRNDYPRIHMIHYIHEWPSGLRKTIKISNKEINHFNAYWKPSIEYNWDEMNNLYARLTEEQKKDGGKNIWP